jgi:glycosyltransferase involved in cell wall biosynthesis
MNYASVNSSQTSETTPTVLWWSRSGRDYSRDRVVRKAFQSLGWAIDEFAPMFSGTADIEASLRGVKKPQLVWVPCFRQRDAAAAQRWARRHDVPLVLDPLISAWDKQVFERHKLVENSAQAQRLLRWESSLFNHSDIVIADTDCHAEFFRSALGVDASKVAVIPVGAEEELFSRQPRPVASEAMRVMFYGSFIGLQGPQFIAQAARHVPEVNWTFIGSGPLLDQCRDIVHNAEHVEFIPRVPYEELASRIGAADVLLGIFGTSEKAARVIPNKVYQALACGRPVITRVSEAYPQPLRTQAAVNSGMTWVSPGCSADIVAAVRAMARTRQTLPKISDAAAATYDTYFSNQVVRESLSAVLRQILPAQVVVSQRAA